MAIEQSNPGSKMGAESHAPVTMADHRAMGSNAGHWLELESRGNYGLDHVVNVRLFPYILGYLDQLPGAKHVIADYGSGTAQLARQLLCADPKTTPGLLEAQRLGIDVERVRAKIDRCLCFEANDLFVRRGQELLTDLGNHCKQANKIELYHTDLSREKPPVKKHTLDLAVSRHVLMHLPGHALAHHLGDVASSLKPYRHYVATVLNPEYEQQKYRERFPDHPSLSPEQKYAYPHGSRGSQELLEQVWRPTEYYLQHFQTHHFSVESVDRLFGAGPVQPGYERYFSPTVPMGLMFEAQNKESVLSQDWYRVSVGASLDSKSNARLQELKLEWQEQNGQATVPAEVESELRRTAEVDAMSGIYNQKYGPQSMFAEEHRRKLEHPVIGETFRDMVRLLGVKRGQTIVNMGVNDGHELQVFNQLRIEERLLQQLIVYGVDISNEALAKAVETHPGRNFRFIHGSGETLDGTDLATGGYAQVPNGCADLYMSITSIQSSTLKQRWDSVFKNIFRVLKPQRGKILIAIPNCFYERGKLVLGRFDASEKRVDHKVARKEVEEICRRLEAAGFDIRTQGEHYIFIAASKGSFQSNGH